MTPARIQPMTAEHLLYHIRTLFSGDNILLALCGVLAAFINHTQAAPPLWQALAVLAVVSTVADTITGVTRACIVKHMKFCKFKDEHNCKLRREGDHCGFNSRSLRAAVIKAGCYSLVFVISTCVDFFLMAMFPGYKGYYMAGFCLALISVCEVSSNFENMRDTFRVLGIQWPFKPLEDKINTALRRAQQISEECDPAKEDKPEEEPTQEKDPKE